MTACVAGLADPTHIYHWRRLDEHTTTSGMPTETELAELQVLGVRHVINLAPHDHAKALPDEPGSVRQLGMAYTHIPVDFKNPTDTDFALFCAALVERQGAPVHVHCAANYRVSAFFYRYRRSVLGRDDAQMRDDLLEIWQPDAVWSAFIER
jgi:uncharacterized protein (TIGR01244 family)